jgi:tRNA G46 methylase TrmB
VSWIPALKGLDAKLRKKAKVADIGCGLGASTILMAKKYPNSKFFGFDYHEVSIPFAEDATEANHNPVGRVFFRHLLYFVFRHPCLKKSERP